MDECVLVSMCFKYETSSSFSDFPDCGSTLTELYGSIISPGFPGSYPGPVECIWNIEGKIDEIITLDMKQFSLGSKNDCGRANLEVRDGSNDTEIGSYCGAVIPRKVRSHSHRMYIKYTTNGVLKGEKFKIDYIRGKLVTSYMFNI